MCFFFINSNTSTHRTQLLPPLSILLPSLPQGYILHRIIFDSSLPPRIPNLACHLFVNRQRNPCVSWTAAAASVVVWRCTVEAEDSREELSQEEKRRPPCVSFASSPSLYLHLRLPPLSFSVSLLSSSSSSSSFFFCPPPHLQLHIKEGKSTWIQKDVPFRCGANLTEWRECLLRRRVSI